MGSVLIAACESVLKYGSGFLRLLYHGLIQLLLLGKKRQVPAMKNPLLFASATSLAAQIREGKVLCQNVVQAYIERIREVQPYIQALAEDRFLEAMAEAILVDKLIASKVETSEQLAEEKPLLGVPLSVKLLMGVKGMHCNGASTVFKDLKAHEDAEIVTLMKTAGAICMGTTNIPEFGLSFETTNYLYGTTKNPYDTRRTAGGSSGGEAALISSGGSVIGLGNDIAGSIRLPASFTGIFGHKPTNGLISNKGSFPVLDPAAEKFLCVGPMCRYAEDLVVAMKVLLGPKSSTMKIGEKVDFSNLQLHYMENEGGNPLVPAPEDDILIALRKVVRHFEKNYEIVGKKTDIKTMKHAFRTYLNIERLAVDSIGDTLTGGKYKLKPKWELLKYLFGRSKFCLNVIVSLNGDSIPFILRKDIAKFEQLAKEMDDEFGAILKDNSVLLLPTFPKKAVFHSETLLLIPSTAYIGIFNVLGYPVTQCAVGLSDDGLPVGIQVVGAKGQDNLTIACAMEIEKAFGGWIPPKN